jgi:hypothetical protein
MFKLFLTFIISFNVFAQIQFSEIKELNYKLSLTTLKEEMITIDFKSIKLKISQDTYNHHLKVIGDYSDELAIRLASCILKSENKDSQASIDTTLLVKTSFTFISNLRKSLIKLKGSAEPINKKSIKVDMSEEKYLLFHLSNTIEETITDMKKQITEKCNSSVVQGNPVKPLEEDSESQKDQDQSSSAKTE